MPSRKGADLGDDGFDGAAFAELFAGGVQQRADALRAAIASAVSQSGVRAIPLVVVCAAGSRSARAVAQLKKLGYENAQSLSGGLKAWR